MRLVLSFLAAFCFAVHAVRGSENNPSASNLLALKGNEFFHAVDGIGYGDEEKFSAIELIRIADKLREEGKVLTKDDKNRDLFRRYFDAACAKATAEELPKLIAIYVALEPGSFEKYYEFNPLAVAWILHALESKKEWPKIELPPLESPMPKELADAPKDLVAAWTLYQRSRQALDSSFPQDDTKTHISFQVNERVFHGLLDDVLEKRRTGLAKELAAFGWSGRSGTFSEVMSEPQSIGIFMALLADGRLLEAVGAALTLSGDRRSTSSDAQKDVRIEFLRKLGLDWEAVFAGAEVDANLQSIPWSTPHLSALAAFGSERAAGLVLQLAARARPQAREGYANAMSAFFPRDPDARSWSSQMIDRRGQETISYDMRLRLLETLQGFAKPDAPADVVTGALIGLGRAKSLATKPTLRALLKHPSPDVTAEAARILRVLGEDVEIPASEPGRFQIFVNGVPAPTGLKVSWDVSNVHSTVETDETGTIKVPREHLLAGQRLGGTMMISSTNVISPAEAPSYAVTLSVPKDLDKLTRVDVKVWPAEVRIERPQPSAKSAGGKASMKVQRHEPKRSENSTEYVYFDPMEKEFKASLDDPLRLSLQSGSYEVEILASGAERFKATFEAGPNAPGVTARLKPGSDVHLEIVRPDGERGAAASLFSKGIELDDASYDYEKNVYRGLPVGDYVLRIPSSAERAAKQFDFVPLQGYAGKEVPFTISGDAPLVDLGEIHLDPAK